MQIFKDNANRDWSLSLTIGTAMKVKEQLGIDLLQPEVGHLPCRHFRSLISIGKVFETKIIARNQKHVSARRF